MNKSRVELCCYRLVVLSASGSIQRFLTVMLMVVLFSVRVRLRRRTNETPQEPILDSSIQEGVMNFGCKVSLIWLLSVAVCVYVFPAIPRYNLHLPK